MDMLDISYKSLLDTQETYQKSNGESTHFTSPQVYNDIQFNEQEESENDSEDNEDSDEGEEGRPKKKKGGLNVDMLTKHDEALKQS